MLGSFSVIFENEFLFSISLWKIFAFCVSRENGKKKIGKRAFWYQENRNSIKKIEGAF